MADDDYYGILEVERNASEDDIKRAYRRQAMRWHPDKNPANKEEAEERFKKIAEAYEVLSDPDKRAVYDRLGKRGLVNGGVEDDDAAASFAFGNGGFFPFGAGQSRRGRGFMFHDPFEIFRQVFGDEVFGSPFFADAGINHTGGHRHRNSYQSGSVQQFGGFPGFGMSMFNDDPFGGFGGFGGFGNVQVQSFSGGFGGGSGAFRSVTTSTRIVNGKQVTTMRVTENGKETVQVEEDGVLKSVKVDGVEQLALEDNSSANARAHLQHNGHSRSHNQSNRSHGSGHSHSHNHNHSHSHSRSQDNDGSGASTPSSSAGRRSRNGNTQQDASGGVSINDQRNASSYERPPSTFLTNPTVKPQFSTKKPRNNNM